MTEEGKEEALWIAFKLDDNDYCVHSGAVQSILVPSALTPLPAGPPSMLGAAPLGEELLGVCDLRTLLHMVSHRQIIEAFGEMKRMHTDWIEELEHCAEKGLCFSLPVDPHVCKFGQWYDHFHTDNYSLRHILKRIAVPHERIHSLGAQIKELMASGGMEGGAHLVEEKLDEARRICCEELIPLLDALIEIYSQVHRGLLLLVHDGARRAGLLVDEVTSLIDCSQTTARPFAGQDTREGYLKGAVLYKDQILLEIDVARVLGNL